MNLKPHLFYHYEIRWGFLFTFLKYTDFANCSIPFHIILTIKAKVQKSSIIPFELQFLHTKSQADVPYKGVEIRLPYLYLQNYSQFLLKSNF